MALAARTRRLIAFLKIFNSFNITIASFGFFIRLSFCQGNSKPRDTVFTHVKMDNSWR